VTDSPLVTAHDWSGNAIRRFAATRPRSPTPRGGGVGSRHWAFRQPVVEKDPHLDRVPDCLNEPSAARGAWNEMLGSDGRGPFHDVTPDCLMIRVAAADGVDGVLDVLVVGDRVAVVAVLVGTERLVSSCPSRRPGFRCTCRRSGDTVRGGGAPSARCRGVRCEAPMPWSETRCRLGSRFPQTGTARPACHRGGEVGLELTPIDPSNLRRATTALCEEYFDAVKRVRGLCLEVGVTLPDFSQVVGSRTGRCTYSRTAEFCRSVGTRNCCISASRKGGP
jgi:hypothetical protein